MGNIQDSRNLYTSFSCRPRSLGSLRNGEFFFIKTGLSTNNIRELFGFYVSRRDDLIDVMNGVTHLTK